MTFYEEKQADLAEEIAEEPVEIGWNPTKPSLPRNAEMFMARHSEKATRFTFVSGGAVRGSDFYLVADKRDFPDLDKDKPKSGYLFEVPAGSGKLFRVGDVQTEPTDPGVEFVMIAKDAVTQ